MSNMLLKTIIGMSSETGSTGSTELPKGSGTKSDPYNWYKILDSNNPNGCHTEWINQNSEEGWIKVKLEGGVTYFAESEFRSAPYFDVRIDGIEELGNVQ